MRALLPQSPILSHRRETGSRTDEAPDARSNAQAAAHGLARPGARADTTLAPVVFSLPNGLDLGGVTTWAVQLASGLAQRGRSVTLICHPVPDGHAPASVRLDPRVRVVRPGPEIPSLHNAAGDLSPFIPLYRDVIEQQAFLHSPGRATGPQSKPQERPSTGTVVYFPNILGDAYALGAALCSIHPELVRVAAWQHTDSDYDAALLARYEPVISRFIAIDDRHVRTLGEKFPQRRADFASIPHGVHVPAAPPPAREPLLARPVRLLYTGRIEHRQKRILALAELSRQLSSRGVLHELTIIGDGPATAELRARLRAGANGTGAGLPSVRLLPAMDAAQLVEHYQRADAFVLPSRYEGLCLSRIEAAAHGCVPIVTTDNSGAGQGLCDGESAIFVTTPSEADEQRTGTDLADAVRRFVRADARALSLRAWESAAANYSLDAHVQRVSRLIDEAAASPPRAWPSNRAVAFSAATGALTTTGAGDDGSGSLGPRAAARLTDLLNRLHAEGSKGVVLHGAGRHTIELAALLACSPVAILGITDDDQARHGQRLLGWTILPPSRASETGARDVVISSHIHAESIWSRRDTYVSQGLRVHRIYA